MVRFIKCITQGNLTLFSTIQQKGLNTIIVINNKNNNGGQHMGTVSVSVPDELKERIASLEEINWSAVARRAFEEKVREVEFLRKIASKSKLTEKDADEIANKINRGMAKRFKGM